MSSESSVGKPDDLSQLEWPPGFAGQLARAIYRGSFNQIKQLSIATTLAILHGTLGRRVQTPTKLDCGAYFIFTAASGIGKDALHVVIRKVFQAANEKNDVIDRFLWQAKPASSEALHAKLLTTPGLILVHREFGKRLKRMAQDNDPNERKFLEQFVDLYEASYLSEKTHANSKNTLPGRPRPAFSFIGDSTTTNYETALTSDMMDDGFLSRLIRIHYDGDIKDPNFDTELVLPDEIQKTWRHILRWAHVWETKTATIVNDWGDEVVIPIDEPPEVLGWSPEGDNAARNRWEAFVQECKQQANSTKDDRWRFLWTRAASKVQKTATILSYANCSHERVLPEVRLGELIWSENLIRQDIYLMVGKLEAGDIGSDDHSREVKLRHLIYNAITSTKQIERQPIAFSQAGMVSHAHLQQRTANLAAFKNHALKAKQALNLTIQGLIDGGWIEEVGKDTLRKDWDCSGRAYRISRELKLFKGIT